MATSGGMRRMRTSMAAGLLPEEEVDQVSRLAERGPVGMSDERRSPGLLR